MDKNKDEYLLVIRLSAMGDVAMTVPVLLALHRENPNLKLLILTRPFFAPIFENVPNTSVFTADLNNKYKGLLGIYRLATELKKLRLVGVADLHNVLRTKLLKLFFLGRRVPFIQINKGRREKRIITSWRKKELNPLKSTHQRYADVFKALGYSITLKEEDFLETCDPTKEVDTFLNPKNKKLIGIAPFAAFTGKMYPINLMEEVLEKVNNTDKYKIILFGGGKEEAELLSSLAKKYTNCFDVVGKLNFADELCLISHLELMVSMDSGNGHLAAMFGIPTVTIWGITHPYAGFAPFGQPLRNSILADREMYPMIPTSVYGNKYPQGYEKVMETIDPQMVYSKIEALLEE